MPERPAKERLLTEEERRELSADTFAKLFTTKHVDFKHHVDRQFDVLKLIGGGNATGVLSTGALLAGTFSHPDLKPLLKYCAATFMGGVIAFVYSYWCLYLWFNALERIFQLSESLQTVGDVDTLRKDLAHASALEGYWKRGAAASFVIFVIGCALVAFGLFRL
jgi:hypothetical protein